MDFQEYRQKPLSEKVSEELIDYISSNGLQPGDKLPTETELTNLLQVGRGTVREAVRLLISRNILVIRRGVGTYVAENFGVSNDPLGLAFFQDKYKLTTDLLQIRMLIEPEIAALAAQYADEDDIAELEALCIEVETLMREGKFHITADQKFHTKIAQCSSNSVVVNLFPIILSSVELLISITRSRLVEETILTHREILEAIRTHNVLQARDAMIMHLMCNKSVLESI